MSALARRLRAPIGAVLALVCVVPLACSSSSRSGSGTTATGSGSAGTIATPAPPPPAPSPAPSAPPPATAPEVTVAFIGDQGRGAGARRVLDLIRSEGADAVVHAGDFDYASDPQGWTAMIDSVLGSDFPYFAAPGNHDESAWDGATGYRAALEERMRRIGIPWTGTLGEASTHSFGGVFFVLVGPGVTGPGDGNYDLFIRDALAADGSSFRVCTWHKNMNRMQLGTKGNDTGWGVYEESRRGGAIIATGHEHSYSRTHLLADVRNQVVASSGGILELAADDPATAADEGRSFAFVSGLGGVGIRNQDRDGAWWASRYTSDQGAKLGALFGVFHSGGDPRLARFYFKNVDGQMIDEFVVRSGL